MDLTTVETLAQQQEELYRNIAEQTVRPMVLQEMRNLHDALMELMRTELQGIRDNLQTSMADFVTQEEVAGIEDRVSDKFSQKFVNQISKKIDARLDEMDTTRERQFAELLQRTEQRFEAVATKEELAGVVASGAENTEQITALRASSITRFEGIESAIAELRRNDDARTREIADIRSNVAAISVSAARTAESAQKTNDAVQLSSRTILELIEQQKQHRKDIDAEFADLRDMQAADRKEVRELESRVNTNSVIVSDMEQRVILQNTRTNDALYGNEETKTPGLIVDVRGLKRGLSWLVFFGTRWGIITLVVLYLVFLAVTAFLLDRPEIIAGFIPRS